MRIALVSEHASPLATLGGVDAGGQNVHVAALARALARRGHHVTVYTRRDEARLPARVTLTDGVDVVHVDAGPAEQIPKDHIYPHVPAFAAALAEDWNRATPDVVHAHFWMSGLASVEAAAAVSVPVVLTFHALGITKRQWQGASDTSPAERIAQEQFLARSCDRIVATAKHEVFDLVRMGAHRQRVTVVPCGVDLNRFSPDGERADHAWRSQRHRVLCVSRLVERKGIDTIIAALPQLPEAELVIAGGSEKGILERDPEARRLLTLARDLGVEHRVTFTGPVPQQEVAALYRSAEVVACTPWYEPFGMVALEAMACGVPAVVSAVGGLVDTVTDGVTGIHIPPRDADALAHTLRTLFADTRLCREMGEAGAARARERYSWDSVATDTARVYSATAARVERGRRSVG